MANELLRRVVIVKDPTAFPEGLNHEVAIYELAKSNKLVVLLSHGNSYNFSPGFPLPINVKLIPYSLDSFDSIASCVTLLRDVLDEYGIELHSRYVEAVNMPVVLSGATLLTKDDTSIEFINDTAQFEQLNPELIKLPPEVIDNDAEWDLT